MTGRVVVVGSVNLDLSVRVASLPGPGQTLLARTLRRGGGGKGANQAVAAARAGGVPTAMVGCVGADADGTALRAALEADDIDCTGLDVSADEPTGTALITVDDAGENTIVVAAGANRSVALGEAALRVIREADVLLAQLEVPQTVLVQAARERRPGALLVLNAAPSAAIDPELAGEVDLLVVNEHEARDLSEAPSVDEAVERLLRRVPAVLVTLGAAGARLARQGRTPVSVPAVAVDAADTTGAGDTFCGALGAAFARGMDDLGALEFASAAASLAVQRLGAQDAVPTREETAERVAAAYRGSVPICGPKE